MQRSLIEGFNDIGSPICGKHEGTTDGTRSIGGICSGACGGAIACGVAAAGGIPLTGGAASAAVVAAAGACGSFAGGCGWCLGTFISWLIDQE